MVQDRSGDPRQIVINILACLIVAGRNLVGNLKLAQSSIRVPMKRTRVGRRWTAHRPPVLRRRASGNAGDVPSKPRQQQGASQDCPRDVRLENAV
jgi:hypothetical protein